MDKPTLESSPPPLPAELPAAAEPDALGQLAQAAKAARLAPADEERATALLKERLTEGRAGITSALGPMIEGLPWIVCVNAVSAVWNDLSVPMRRHLLSGVAKNTSESARRLHLSLARAVFKLEPAAGLKAAAASAAALQDPETGALNAKYRQFFFNVFIGKGKPWLLQLPLAELKAAEADALVHAALESFSICPPLSQLSILRWADAAGRLKKCSDADLEAAAKAVVRWNTKLQRQLKAEIAELPPALESALKPEALKPAPEPKPEAKPEPAPKPSKGKKGAPKPAPEPAEPGATPAPLLEELIIPGRAERLAKKEEEIQSRKRSQPESAKPAKQVEPQEARESREPQSRESRKQEPREERRERGRESARAFDLKEALHGVESYVAALRTELEAAKVQLRRAEQEGKRGNGRSTRATAEPLPPAELEALNRHNARLEATVAELRSQLEDLASHHESVAESRQMHGDEPLPESGAEPLKALLAIKLQEAYETYHAMRLEPLDKVFRLDYRDLLGSVFDTLSDAGIRLQ